MGRVEQRLYRRRLKRRRALRTILLLTLTAGIALLLVLREEARQMTAETIAQPTSTPITASWDQTVQTREVLLSSETWYAIQTGVFSTEEAAQSKSGAYADRGAPGTVVQEGSKWRVFIACFGSEEDASAVRQHLGESQRVETYLYRWTCPEVSLKLTGMAGQLDVAEAGFTLVSQVARALRDTATNLDVGEYTLTDARAAITDLDTQVVLWANTARDRFGRSQPSPIRELLALTDEWSTAKAALSKAETATALSAALKGEGMTFYDQVVKLRQQMLP